MKKFIVGIMMSIAILLMATTTVSANNYTVTKGDNLWEIAMDHDTTMQNLMAINDLDSTIIQPDQIITIDNVYKVKRGDTLSEIAKEKDVTVDELMKWNDLDSSLILIGEELILKSGKSHNEAEVSANQSKEKTKPTPSVKPKVTKSKTKTKNSVEKVPKKAVKQEAKKQETKNQEVKKQVESQAEKSKDVPDGKVISVKATAYTAKCDGCTGITYTGVDLNKDPHAKVIAVDPTVIPLGTKVYVEGYGEAIAADIGGAIKGNRIDIHLPTKKEAFSWGVRNVNVTIVE